MLQPFSQWILAAILATTVVAVAHRMQRLSPSGAVSAALLGTIIVGTGGWLPGVVLVSFFVSSSLLSASSDSTHTQARGSRRDWIQVLANGWGMLLGCLLFAITGWTPWLLFGVGAVAAATADTWSSELGRKSSSPPRLITTGKIVAPGTSGAISLYGSLAAVGGAAMIALIAAVAIWLRLFDLDTAPTRVLIAITLAGVGGAMLDSVLGATVQEQRWCDSCGKATEANPHRCGAATRQIDGLTGFSNDVVNIICVLTGALIGLVSGIL